MSRQQVNAGTAQPPRRSAARERILAAADQLFYGEGIRAVGVDRVVSEAEVTRATFYRHFPSKDALITEYLKARLQHDQEALARLRREHPDDPRTVLAGIVETLSVDTSVPDFRGCPYANLTAEICEVDHPARRVAAEHRAWLLGELESLLSELGVAQPDVVAEQLAMLRAGAMAVASVRSTDQLVSAFTKAWTTLIDHASAPGA
jgi:AcrR family transcriptional regulator